MIYWLIVLILLLVGIYDWNLYSSGKKTISQKYHKMFPQWIDSIILIVIGGLTWWLFSEKVFALWALGVVCGHLFWED